MKTGIKRSKSYEYKKNLIQFNISSVYLNPNCCFNAILHLDVNEPTELEKTL